MSEQNRSRDDPRWRVGSHQPRNVYRDNEPVAMCAGPKEDAEALAAFIVFACNEKEARDPW